MCEYLSSSSNYIITAMTGKRVYIFKEMKSPGVDEYDKIFRSHAYQPLFIPVLDHTTTHIDQLKDILSNGPTRERIRGLILTSQRSVEAINKAYCLLGQLDNTVLEQWSTLPVYIVGQQTANALSQLPLFSSTHHKWLVAPRAAELIPPMIEKMKVMGKEDRMLFLAGDKRRDLIPQALSKADIPFLELQTYATCCHPNLQDSLSKIRFNPSDWCLYFSPSGVKFILSVNPWLQEYLFTSDHAPKIAAIGPTTADYIHEIGGDVHVIADEPDAYHIMGGIVHYDNKDI
ncbi:tetrapyrrole biosynthesis, uroporphyrinogen III synthase [Pilobolus umbonatus]|nr:tetrapyrrole biosynthesis, uroporphyrinogen III synthase [Pilobolus umbonatus]